MAEVWNCFQARQSEGGRGGRKRSEVPTGKTIWYNGFIFAGDMIIFFLLCVVVLPRIVKCPGLRVY